MMKYCYVDDCLLPTAKEDGFRFIRIQDKAVERTNEIGQRELIFATEEEMMNGVSSEFWC
jgi:hypothetical protein